MIALMAQISIGWSLVVASLALLIAAHVFGTFVGTRLRDTSEELQRWKARPGSFDFDYPVAAVPPVSVADLCLPAPTLAGYERIGRWRNWFIAGGTLLGALLGGFAFHAVAGEELTFPGLALGLVSCGVLGSWASLLVVNFYAIARHTLKQANQDLARDRVRR
jgi:hypothetical protein